MFCPFNGQCSLQEQPQRLHSFDSAFDQQLAKARSNFAKCYNLDPAPVTRSWINQTSLGVDGWADAVVRDYVDEADECKDAHTVMATNEQNIEPSSHCSSRPFTRTTTQSCLRDAVMSLATVCSHQPVLRDLSVTRRETVPAGCAGSRRAALNFLRIQNILSKHRISV